MSGRRDEVQERTDGHPFQYCIDTNLAPKKDIQPKKMSSATDISVSPIILHDHKCTILFLEKCILGQLRCWEDQNGPKKKMRPNAKRPKAM